MLPDLKQSTFKANDVFMKAIGILKGHYFSIAGLCLFLFITSSLSSYLAFTLADSSGRFVKGVMCFIFVTLFFGTQLVLIKRALLLARGVEHAALKDYVPSAKQFVNFLLGFILYSVLVGVVYLLSSLLSFPLLYLGVETETLSMEVNPFLTGLFMMFVLIRITFFPYFIVDKKYGLFRACRFSLALTKGNVVSLLLLMLVVGTVYILQASSEYLGYFIIAKVFSAINTFVIIPSVSLVMATAYHNMMRDYKGGDDPHLLKNII